MEMIKITGMKGIISKLQKTKSKLNSSISRGLYKGGQYLQRESQKIVPVMTGNLRGTAFTRKISWDHVTVGYTASYAAFVHENLNAAHGKAFNVKHAAEIARAGRMTTSKSGRQTFKPTKGKLMGTAAGGMFPRGENQQAKFLERPMREKRNEILKIVAAEASKI